MGNSSKVHPREQQIVCPFCQTRGEAAGYRVKVKRGISGGKANEVLLTKLTLAHCDHCGQSWMF